MHSTCSDMRTICCDMWRGAPGNVCPATGKWSLRVDVLEAFHKPLAMVSTARARNKPLSEEALCKAAICTLRHGVYGVAHAICVRYCDTLAISLANILCADVCETICGEACEYTIWLIICTIWPYRSDMAHNMHDMMRQCVYMHILCILCTEAYIS